MLRSVSFHWYKMLRATGACKGPRVLGKQDPSAAPSPAWQRASPLHRTTSPCCCVTSVLLPSEDLSSWFCLLPDSQLCSVIVFSSVDSYPAAVLYILLIFPGTLIPSPLPQRQPHHQLPGCKTTDQSPPGRWGTFSSPLPPLFWLLWVSKNSTFPSFGSIALFGSTNIWWLEISETFTSQTQETHTKQVHLEVAALMSKAKPCHIHGCPHLTASPRLKTGQD